MITKPDLTGWFPDENRTTLTKLIKDYQVESVIEVGCFLGKATVFFASQCPHTTAIDIFANSGEKYIQTVAEKLPTMYEQFMFNLNFYGVADRVTVLTMPSVEAAKLNLRADLIYIDASHRYEDVKQDIALWYPNANKILCGDDNTAGFPEVQKAVKEAPFEANMKGRVWYTIKN